MSSSKHKNYEILNLIGYGLAKFGLEFVRQFDCSSKAEFYQKIVNIGIADTIGTVKNRQDLFDPFFDNGRQGWWQKGDVYIHRKHFIDSLFGEYVSHDYANTIKVYIANSFSVRFSDAIPASPIVKTKFKQLQETGKEAESYFLANYKSIIQFNDATIEDARLFGDGYDFQIQFGSKFYLVEVKGVRAQSGAFRMTENEFSKAEEYQSVYGLVVVSNLEKKPKMTIVFNPLSNFELAKNISKVSQVSYHSASIKW